MTSKSNIFFNYLLSQKGRELSQFSSYLTEELTSALHPEWAAAKDPSSVMLSPQMQLRQIHYSWIGDRLNQETIPLQKLFCAALPETLFEPLQKQFPYPDLSLSEPIQTFLIAGLIKRLFPRAVLPIPCLPPSPLKGLLDLPKQKLVRLIGFLGLRDLAQELRKTLDKEAILAIQSLLSTTQKRHLEAYMREQDILPPTSYGLKKWGAGKHELTQIAQVQGLTRLGKALANDKRSLLWHIAHKLDMGRGKLVISHGTQDVSSTISKRLTQQITSLLEALNEG